MVNIWPALKQCSSQFLITIFRHLYIYRQYVWQNMTSKAVPRFHPYKTQCAHNWYVCSLYTTLYSPLYTTQTGNTVFNVQYSALLPLLPWCATRVTRQHIPSAGSKGRIVNKARRLSRTQDSSTSQLIASILTIIFKKHPMTKHLLPKMCIDYPASFAIQIPPQTNGKLNMHFLELKNTAHPPI